MFRIYNNLLFYHSIILLVWYMYFNHMNNNNDNYSDKYSLIGKLDGYLAQSI